jgi:P pilus assembly chaperone PapD
MRNSIVLLLFIVFASKIFAQGDLLINPIRVVFEGQKQNADLNLTNIGKDTAVYMVSFLSYKMLEDGSFLQLDKPDTTFSADKYLRLFPRKVVLPPNESQTIRLQLRKPSSLKQAEYRSHIYFRAEKQTTPRGMKDLKVDSTRMAVSITPVFGISIPVIVRNGALSNQLSLSDLSLQQVNDSISRLNLTINRSGTKSAYGNLKVEFQPVKGQKSDIGFVNGIGIYPEISKRFFALMIKNTPAMKTDGGKLIIRFFAPNEDGGAEITRSELILKK